MLSDLMVAQQLQQTQPSQEEMNDPQSYMMLQALTQMNNQLLLQQYYPLMQANMMDPYQSLYLQQLGL